MAISLESLKKPQNRTKIITITGEAGTGKTTLAANFPAPVLIPVEDGTAAIQDHDCMVFPQPKNSSEVLDMITALAKEDHEYKTLIIDSITQLDTMFTSEIIEGDSNKPASLNQALGGYGAGYGALSDLHRKVREYCGRLSTVKKMHIVFIAHSQVETIDTPDQEPYMRHTLALHQKSLKHYVDNADLVGHTRLKMFTRTAKDKSKANKAISTGERELVCHLTASNICKNRFGIEEALPLSLDSNPLAQYL